MIVLALLAAITAAGVGLTTLVVVHGRAGDDRGGPRADLVRFWGLAALAALACGAMNVLEHAGGGAVAAAAGNATNLLSAGLVWAGARRLNARRAIGTMSVGAMSILMFGMTFLMSLDQATVAKTAGLFALAAVAGGELWRRPAREVSGARIMAGAMGLFAVYNGIRLVVAAAAGMSPLHGDGLLSAPATAVASSVTIVLVGLAAVRMGRQLDDSPSPGTRAHDRGALRRGAHALLSERASADVIRIRVPEFDLIRAAHGLEHAEAVLRVLAEAADRAVPGATSGVPTRGSVFVVAPPTTDIAEREDAIRRAFADAMPGIDYDDAPDVVFQHDPITRVDDLSFLLESQRLRPR